MINRTTLSRLAQRTALVIGVGAVAITGGTAGAASPDSTIDTWSSWDGCCTLGPFGHPDTSTYGQTITIPAGKKKFKWVKWYMVGGVGDLVFRSELYTWDGSKAGKEVSESKPKTLTLDGTPEYQGVKFKFKKAKVKPGQQYVVFATISKDYEETDPNLQATWPVHNESVLDGGNTVWLNDSGNEALWTTQAWSGIAAMDMAFQAQLK